MTTDVMQLGMFSNVSRSLPTASMPVGGAAGADFGDTIVQLLADGVATVAKGEATAVAGIQGKASVQDVVQSVMQAEQALHAMVAVRDKVVGAYLEISRMQI
ncbi:MAG: flagellar hook-basal body complex protein FliE [Hyphomicrobium sp.]